MRYRWRVKQVGRPDRLGRWRDTREEARQAAVRAGVASWSKEHGWFFDVLTSIEGEDDRCGDPA